MAGRQLRFCSRPPCSRELAQAELMHPVFSPDRESRPRPPHSRLHLTRDQQEEGLRPPATAVDGVVKTLATAAPGAITGNA
jgi:hypothetical protein